LLFIGFIDTRYTPTLDGGVWNQIEPAIQETLSLSFGRIVVPKKGYRDGHEWVDALPQPHDCAS